MASSCAPSVRQRNTNSTELQIRKYDVFLLWTQWMKICLAFFTKRGGEFGCVDPPTSHALLFFLCGLRRKKPLPTLAFPPKKNPLVFFPCVETDGREWRRLATLATYSISPHKFGDLQPKNPKIAVFPSGNFLCGKGPQFIDLNAAIYVFVSDKVIVFQERNDSLWREWRSSYKKIC